MKKLLLLSFSFCCSTLFAQVTNEGTPASWNLPQQKVSYAPIEMPKVDLVSLYVQDQVNDKIKSKPYRIGVPMEVDFGLQNAGFWTSLPNGDRIWRIFIESTDAVHLSFNLDEFYLPEGGKIYLYTDDRSDLLGAYTATQNNQNNQLGTWFVNGDKVWIEYLEPADVIGEGRLHIESVIHGYRMGHTVQKSYGGITKLNESDDCQHDVDCPVGSDFDNIKDEVKKSVAFLNLGNGYICSGGLVNNTAQDKKPYFLSADHCYTDPDGVDSNPALYSMRFNWISPNPVCAQTTNSTSSIVNQTISGATLRARNANSDFMLVELNNSIDLSWDVTYAGWDRTDTDPTFSVGIHHPKGDIMKISRDNESAYKSDNSGTKYWVIGGVNDNVAFGGLGGFGLGGGWEIGSTEGGSSGSPLFNQDGLVIGQLYGGASECQNLIDNDNYDVYGRFAASWDDGDSAGNRLKDWLDPGNTGQTTLPLLKSTLAVADEQLNRDITVYPNPSTGMVSVEIKNSLGAYEYELFNVLGQSLQKNTLTNNRINLSTLPSAFYYLKIVEKESSKFAVKKIIINK